MKNTNYRIEVGGVNDGPWIDTGRTASRLQEAIRLRGKTLEDMKAQQPQRFDRARIVGTTTEVEIFGEKLA